jgi:hypothetical protein
VRGLSQPETPLTILRTFVHSLQVAPRVDCKLRANHGASAVLADSTNAARPSHHSASSLSAAAAAASSSSPPKQGAHSPPTARRGSSFRKSLKHVKSRVYGHLHSAPPRTKPSPEASPERLDHAGTFGGDGLNWSVMVWW